MLLQQVICRMGLQHMQTHGLWSHNCSKRIFKSSLCMELCNHLPGGQSLGGHADRAASSICMHAARSSMAVRNIYQVLLITSNLYKVLLNTSNAHKLKQ